MPPSWRGAGRPTSSGSTLAEPLAAGIVISDLREQPEFRDTVAERIWRAWWKERGFPLKHMLGRVGDSMNTKPIPFALVAHRGARFLGTASVIAADLDERPDLTPWVAAVWVDPDYRKQQIGRALVARAAADVFALGYRRVYLCALQDRHEFYIRQGWQPIDRDVGPRRLTVFAKDASTA